MAAGFTGDVGPQMVEHASRGVPVGGGRAGRAAGAGHPPPHASLRSVAQLDDLLHDGLRVAAEA
ncbi:hypothetical protein A3L22_30265 [Streptomyces griseus subsp. griseus]|nr:hypothetical protein A3L22_30265 [Streptomyces griseus subsp. griseus]